MSCVCLQQQHLAGDYLSCWEEPVAFKKQLRLGDTNTGTESFAASSQWGPSHSWVELVILNSADSSLCQLSLPTTITKTK